MLGQIELVYRQDLVRISNLIHSKPTVAFEDPVPRSSNAEDNTTVRLRVFPWIDVSRHRCFRLLCHEIALNGDNSESNLT